MVHNWNHNSRTVSDERAAGGPLVAIDLSVIGAAVGGSIAHLFGAQNSVEGFDTLTCISATAFSLLSMLALRSWAMRSEPSRMIPTKHGK